VNSLRPIATSPSADELRPSLIRQEIPRFSFGGARDLKIHFNTDEKQRKLDKLLALLASARIEDYVEYLEGEDPAGSDSRYKIDFFFDSPALNNERGMPNFGDDDFGFVQYELARLFLDNGVAATVYHNAQHASEESIGYKCQRIGFFMRASDRGSIANAKGLLDDLQSAIAKKQSADENRAS